MSMPSMMGKAKAKERLLSTLPDEFRKVAQQANVPLNDFPNPYIMKAKEALFSGLYR
jgi:hypothetical protein